MTRSLNAFGLAALVLLIVAGISFVLLRNEPPKLIINEFLAHNISCCPDTSSGESEYDDWIEIHNYGGTPVNIAGMYLSQDPTRKKGAYKIRETQPELTTIPPGGFLVLWADASPGQGVLHLGFKLDQDGEFLGLYDTHGRTIDGFVYEEQARDVSQGRSPDGAKDWVPITVPSPGAPNR
jgi:Lamin Tail Domain